MAYAVYKFVGDDNYVRVFTGNSTTKCEDFIMSIASRDIVQFANMYFLHGNLHGKPDFKIIEE